METPLEIDFSPLIGQSVRADDVEVTDRQIMMFAAALGETADRYLDDSRADGLVAPPTFPVTRSWPLVAQLQERFRDALPASALPRMVHGAERLLIHRPIHASDTLSVVGRPVAVSSSEAGARLTVEVKARDPEHGPVFTEYATLLFRGVRHRGEALSIAELPESPPAPDEARVVWTRPLHIDRGAAHVYDACTGITFPIHTSVAFARGVGLGDIILQGTATLGVALREIISAESIGDPGRVREVAGRFTGVLIPGTTATLRLMARVGGARHFEILDHLGRAAVSRGYLRVE